MLRTAVSGVGVCGRLSTVTRGPRSPTGQRRTGRGGSAGIYNQFCGSGPFFTGFVLEESDPDPS